MNKRSTRWIIIICTLLLIASGCKKKTPPPPPPPPPPVKPEAPAPPKPVAKIEYFQAEPSSIQRGQSSTLRWNVTADSVTIEPGIGTVPAQGSRQVYPSDSTTYTLSARSAGGNDSRTVRVTVTEPPAPPPPAPAPVREEPLAQMLERMVSDVYFDYDKYDVREDSRSALTRNADSLKQIFSKYPGASITVEGHCDERGSAEYNLGLGDRRATSARDFLVQLGVPGDKLKTISYGKERPQCTDATEDCYQKNRRAHFTAQ